MTEEEEEEEEQKDTEKGREGEGSSGRILTCIEYTMHCIYMYYVEDTHISSL